MTDYRNVLYGSYRSTQYELNNPCVFNHRMAESYRADFAQWLPWERKARILDLGCGSGFLLSFLKQEGYENILGIDASPEQVKFAKSKGLPVVLGDGVTFLENNKGFDLIILTDVVEHMKKDELLGLLRRSYEALVPDGHIIIRTPNASSIFGCYGRYIDFTHEISFTEQSLRQVLLATGFENVKLTDTKIPIGWKPKRLGRWLVVKIWRFFLQLLYMAELGTTRPRLCGGNLIACAYKPKCQPE